MIASTLRRLRRMDLRITGAGPSAYLWSSLAHYGLRAVLPKQHRDQAFVMNEYNHDRRDEYWKGAMSADELIFGNAERRSWALVDNKLCQQTERHVREHLLPRLRDRVADRSRAGDLIVEFGAGTGRNLAYLARELPDRRYLGLELAPRSVELARHQLGELGLPIEMRAADVTKPVSVGRAAIAYSVLALEQLPDAMSRAAVANMAAIATNAIICYEPIRELYPLDVRGIASRLRQWRADYLSGLLTHVRELGLEIAVQQRTGLAHNPLNEICELIIQLAPR